MTVSILDNGKQHDMNKSVQIRSKQKNVLTKITRSFHNIEFSEDSQQSARLLAHSFSKVKLSEDQRKLIKLKNYIPPEVTLDLLNDNADSKLDLKSFAKEQGNTDAKLSFDTDDTSIVRNQSPIVHKKQSPRRSLKKI